jgi:ribosomal protein S27E
MNLTEKVAYLRGLAEGLELDESTKEGKLLKAIVDVLDDVALTVSDLEDEVAELSEVVDEVDEDLGEVEEFLYDDLDDHDDDYDYDFDDDEEFYEVFCPECGESIHIDEEALEDEQITCPNCGEIIDIEIEDDEEESEEEVEE